VKLKQKIKRHVRAAKGYFHNRRLIRDKVPAPTRSEVDSTRFSDCQIILAAIDAVSWDILWPLIEQGRAPNLGRLVANGSYGPLRTLYPALSPELWNSIGTGKVPNKHGVVGFVAQDPKSGKLVPYTSNMRRCKAIWEILGDYGKKVSVIGWWNTWPAEPVNGTMVSGILGYKEKDLGGPKRQDNHVELTRKGRLRAESFSDQTFPEGLFEKVKYLIRTPDKVDDAHPFMRELWSHDSDLSKTEREVLRLITHVYNSDRTYVDIAKHLLDTLSPDLLTFYVAGVDVVGHKYWAYMEPQSFSAQIPRHKIDLYKDVLKDYYTFVDEVVGHFVSGMKEDTIMAVISDHGMSADNRKFSKTGVNSGRHLDEDGVFILSGPHIRRNHRVEGSSILDVTPTLLASLGFPVGADMDGCALSEVFEEGFLEKYPLYYIEGYDKGKRFDSSPIESPVDEEIKERLRSLGYIE
jgi:predicted AlkP superfamily phosphohydrolase/phosphomutase